MYIYIYDQPNSPKITFGFSYPLFFFGETTNKNPGWWVGICQVVMCFWGPLVILCRWRNDSRHENSKGCQSVWVGWKPWNESSECFWDQLELHLKARRSERSFSVTITNLFRYILNKYIHIYMIRTYMIYIYIKVAEAAAYLFAGAWHLFRIVKLPKLWAAHCFVRARVAGVCGSSCGPSIDLLKPEVDLTLTLRRCSFAHFPGMKNMWKLGSHQPWKLW